MTSYYPVLLNLTGKRVVVIGGGMVAERKVRSLIRTGASVTVISPELTRGLRRLSDTGAIVHLMRAFRKSDLRGAFAVIAATNSEETNTRVAAAAPALVNVVDVPELCNFIAPSVVRRGPLVIAISTSGASPALARSLRKELEALYGADFGALLQLLGDVRKQARRDLADRRQREIFLKEIASEKMLRIFRSRGLTEVRRMADTGLLRLAGKKQRG